MAIMQAKLPDINSAIVRHRGGALVAMAQDPVNYSLAATELSAINSLLPEEYKVKIDSFIYYEKIRAQDVLTCNNCEKEIEHHTLEFYDKQLERELSLLYQIDFIQVWQCPECQFENPKDGTKRTIRKFEAPYYTGYIPDPPKMDSFGNRVAYLIQFQKWFDIALSELESKIGEYRTDYAKQQDDTPTIQDEED